MEDIVKIKTKWLKSLISDFLAQMARKAGYNLGVNIADLEIKHVESSESGPDDEILATVVMTVRTDTRTVEKLIRK
jgi:hypothetical protein